MLHFHCLNNPVLSKNYIIKIKDKKCQKNIEIGDVSTNLTTNSMKITSRLK